MKYIDIHPHIIADDTKRYPLAPLGGHQSDWSRTRPSGRGAAIGRRPAWRPGRRFCH
jgi:hypothetical protein